MEKRQRGRPRGRTVGAQFGVRLPPHLEDALHRVAEREDRPAAGIVRQALRQYLADDLQPMADSQPTGDEAEPIAGRADVNPSDGEEGRPARATERWATCSEGSNRNSVNKASRRSHRAGDCCERHR